MPHKIHKYQGNEQPPVQGNPAKPARWKVPAFMSLADEYGFEDDNMRIGKWHGGKQTVNEEYQVYVVEAPLEDDTDPLKFWEVSGDGDINSS